MSESAKVRRFGWKPSLPDVRNHKYGITCSVSLTLPPAIDLRSQCPPVYDQIDIGSCTANALAGLFQFVRTKEKKPNWTPSRLFIYYNERVIENTVNDDAGAALADGMKVLKNIGAPHESLWWYNTLKFAAKPSNSVYAEAARHKCSRYLQLNNNNIQELKSCVASGYPFVFGFTAYESLESDQVARSGILAMPQPNEKAIGGHAVMCVGYDDNTLSFVCRNSWGPRWGQAGYFTIPYSYVTNTNLCQDFWTLQIAN